MTSAVQEVKSLGPKLVLFFKTVAIYFVLFIPSDSPSCTAMLIKVLPILSLVFFIFLHGISLGDEHSFSRRIVYGLTLCSIADALLIWPQYFVAGMGVFALAHLFYISAFGFKPFKPVIGLILYSIAVWALSLMYPKMHGVLLFGVPIYTAILSTMTWRAAARVRISDKSFTWTKFFTCLGAILFTVSDAIIGFNMFYQPINNAQALVMGTYYAAQLGIALSVVDSRASYEQQKLLQKKQ